MENAPGKENTFPRLYAGSGRVPEDTARRVVFASWALLEPTDGHTDAPAAAAVREELMRCVARGEPPVLCLYAGEDPAWFAAKGGWLAEDNLRCFLRYAGRAARAQRQLPETRIGFVLRMYPAIDLRRGLLRGDNAATASAYEILPLLAMARGNFLPPLRNTLRIRPGSWADFLAVSGGGDKEKRRYCCHAAATLAETEIWEVMNDREDT